ncbi:serine/threonine-protein kinase [Actinoplanes subglobosus]|uniref:Serine/threonine-protein kinase n=1 Tax=Actinoplanes subglobosus TaxID=1547892 RepID=A0ABV8IL28_9ACTN
MSTADLPGSGLLAGRYRLVERLGAGGMSVVWRGFDEVLGRQVAVKVLPPSTSADPSFRRRLRAEAQAAARLTHPNITNVYDYGEATTVDGEPVPYVVMELVDGESLAAVLARVRTLPWPTAARISAEVAAALASAHSRGIVHRDVTPANVMLTPSGAKVVDFGISALIGENDTDPDGSLMGTPAYLAPERLEGGQVSPATDVYAVGLLIYRMLIGQLPWDVGTTTALLRAHQYVEPEPLPPVDGLPQVVDALIARCLEKHPGDRPSSAELAGALATIAAGAPPVTSGFDADWEDGEDTFILPSGYPYSGFGPAAAAASVAAGERPTVGAEPPTGPEPVYPVSSPEPYAAPVSPPSPPLRHGSGGPSSAPPDGRPPRRGTVRARRIVVVAGTVALLSALTYGWTELGQPRTTSQAGAIPGPAVVPVSGECVVSYAVWSDTGGKFKAQVTLANRADVPVPAWNLWFLMNGDQTLSGNGKVALAQEDREIRVTSKAPINPQRTTTMQITGRYTESNLPPMVFKLNGKTCETYVSAEPGQPSLPVEHLENGEVRFGDPVTSPGISIGPSGSVTLVPTPSTTGTVKPSTGPGTSASPSASPTAAPSSSQPSIAPSPPPPPPSDSPSPSPSENPGVGESSPTPTPPPTVNDDCDADVDVCPTTG